MPPMVMTMSNAIELARNDLAAYAAAMWPRFECPPHIRTLISVLEAVERGDFDRVNINFPPRHGKSFCTSQLFPAWYLGRHPDHSIIASSYGQELASDFGRQVRNFVTDPLHERIFPHCRVSDDSSAIHRFGLLRGGNYFAVGSGGSITGRGADLLLIDDPVKGTEEARSATAQRSLRSWYENTAYTRLAPGGRIVIISTRWHEGDLSGWLLKEHASEGWKTISMPAIAEADEGWRNIGDPLWPQRYPLETLDRIREAIGTQAWLSLYQQRPTAEEGGIFRKNWWKRYAEPPEVGRRVFSLDTAFKTGQGNDYSVVQVWGETKTGYYLLHVSRGRWEFPELKRQVVALADIWKPHAVLIEDAASGQSLIQSLKSETRLPIKPIKPLGDKQSRASAISPLVESGRVYIPESAPWLNDFIEELSSFPAAPHDDQADALTQALTYLRGVSVKFEWTPALRVERSTSLDGVFGGSRSTAGIRGSVGIKPESIADDRREAAARRDPRRKFGGF
jgi:predicted phage terminase large subunit-like protein